MEQRVRAITGGARHPPWRWSGGRKSWLAAPAVVYKPMVWKTSGPQRGLGEWSGVVAERWTRESWRRSRSPGARVSGQGGAASRREAARELSAAGVCRRGAQPQGAARPRRDGRGFPAAGRRLRRELHRSERQQHQRQQHPRLPARVPADGGGADLCRRRAGGEGRPHRRPVRQAALVADREEERPGAAELSRRHHQRRRSSPPPRACPIRRG